MTPKKFEYILASDLPEAISNVNRLQDRAKILAGGQSLIPLMKLRLASPEFLIDISDVKELSYIREESGNVTIGAVTRYRDVMNSSLVRNKFPILIDAVESIGDAQIRNRGTVGGNLCHADPASDLAPAIIALNSRLKILGADGKQRLIPAGDFFLDTFSPNLNLGEILAEVIIPSTLPNSTGAYAKFTEISGGFAIVGVAVQIALEDTVAKRCKEARIALSAVASTPVRAIDAENYLAGKELNPDILDSAASRVAEVVTASDVQGSARYRKQLTKVLFKKAISKSLLILQRVET